MVREKSSRAIAQAIVACFWGLALVCAWLLYADWREAARISKWPSTEAEVTSVRCVRERVGTGYQPRAELAYRYRAGGVVYSGRDRVPGCEAGAGALSPLRTARAYTRAFYDPASPQASRLTRTESLAVPLMAALLTLGISAFLTAANRLEPRPR